MLTVDLDSQSKEMPEKTFFNQALELADYKINKPYKNRMLPFLCIDPYNPVFQRRTIKDVAIEYLVKNDSK